MTYAVAHVRTNDEQNVSERLLEIGVSSYCPKGSWRVSNGRRRRQRVERAAFPGYIFVEAGTVGYSDRVYDVAGFYDFLRVQGEWYLMESIDYIRSLEERGAFSQKNKGKPGFTIGEVLRVPDGVFGGMEGEVVAQQDGFVWLSGYDFKYTMRINGLTLFGQHVECTA